MDDSKYREKVAKEIAKTSDLIRKKYRVLKTGKMEEDIALERHFKPIIDPLKRIVENTDDSSKDPDRNNLFGGRRGTKTQKETTECSVTDEPLVTSIRYLLQTSEGQEKLQTNYGPLGQKYMKAVLTGKKAVNIDVVYGVYFSNEGTMLSDKRITLHKNDDIIIDGKRYDGTAGLYELIFMKFPNESICTDDDVHIYRSILLTTNAHKRDHSPSNQVMGSKGYKYKNTIAPMVSDKKVGTGINKRADLPRTMTLNDNKIDYIHWDDPNEIVDRLRLLEASRQAGYNGHDNEILSIIEELREARLIIN
ncbi:hypothetical protein ALC57_04456 [Trachymyrmex cornetzi]|uniref:DUF8207 domain-containing protein n=1 Tax=Trachymyrmex cornetzi TaxID=471704 RepID=A0A151JC63_9HYME|nr:hypothetical protein ALC57_04456 [Trachymyrmex cornetzi]